MKLFMLVLSLSLSGTLIGLFITALRPLTRKYFSAKWNYYIWLLVIVRLLLPFHFDSDFHTSIQLNELTAVNAHSTEPNSAIRKNTGSTITGSHISQGAASSDAHSMIHQDAASSDTDNPIAALTAPDNGSPNTPLADMNNNSLLGRLSGALTTQKLLTAAAYLWFLGAILLLLIKLANYHCFKAAVKKTCVPITDRRITDLKNSFCIRLHILKSPALYESPTVSSPLTIGLFHPVIILPKSPAAEQVPPQFQLILHHELIHVARKDLLYKWGYQLLLCLHWFNPFLHCIGRQIDRDCELSCDERILAHLTETGRQMYGNLLLDTAERAVSCRRSTLATTLFTNKKDLKERLAHIVHYQKIPRFRLALSVCIMIIALMFTACGTIWISQDEISEVQEKQSETDSDNENVFSQFLNSLSSDYNYREELKRFRAPQKTGDAWNAYDDDSLLVGNDIKEGEVAYNYYYGDNNHLRVSSYALYGTSSILIANAEQDIDVRIATSFVPLSGKFKVIYIAPDKSIITLNDTGDESTQTVTMKKGRNVLKVVGQGAKLQNLHIDFSDLNANQFESVYYSEQEEYAYLAKDSILSGEPYQLDKIMEVLHYMEPKEISDVFHALLTAGTAFTTDELCDFLIYSDASLSSQYLIEALRDGSIQQLSADAVSELIPHLDQQYCAELLKTLSTEAFYDAFSENIYCLNDPQIEECLTHYLDEGGVLTYSMYKEISPYLSDNTIKMLDKRLFKQ
ncbi:MAG: M56 family metallopeptidase [Lachnospiraceae bacterium]|nr:M56 family metallopeptidase [Lachnospiraceae bacterium]